MEKKKKAKAIVNEPMKSLMGMFPFLLTKQLRPLMLTFTYVNNSDMFK